MCVDDSLNRVKDYGLKTNKCKPIRGVQIEIITSVNRSACTAMTGGKPGSGSFLTSQLGLPPTSRC